MCVPASTRLALPAVVLAQRREQAQREQPVLVAEVRAEAQQEAGRASELAPDVRAQPGRAPGLAGCAGDRGRAARP